LLEGKQDVHPDCLSAGAGCTPVRGLHDAGPGPRTDDEILPFGLHGDGPLGKLEGQLFGFLMAIILLRPDSFFIKY